MTVSNEPRAQSAAIYRFLSRIFRREPDAAAVAALRGVRFPEAFAQGLSPAAQKWLTAGARFNRAVSELASDAQETLAVDFAHAFLGAGVASGEAAFPYASVYTSEKRSVMQEAWSRMHELLSNRGLAAPAEQAELLDDHLAVELDYAAWLCENGSAKELREFLNVYLLGWVPAWCADAEKYAETEFYRAAVELTESFLRLEYETLSGQQSAPVKTGDGTAVPAAKPLAPEARRSFVLDRKQADGLFAALCERFKVCGPAFGTGAEEGVVRFRPLGSFSELVLDRQSDYSAKELWYPISQTIFRFDENDYRTELPENGRPLLILARPCDINAIGRLDNIFLRNGGRADLYYETLRSRVRFALLECGGGFDGCWCVSMGTNRTDDYALALRFTPDALLAQVADESLLPLFSGAAESDFTPEFVRKNAREAHLPRIGEVKQLQQVFDLDFWKEFNGKCISCGGCNTVCPTCSCYETADFLDQENSRKGERRRVWASCMIPEFTRTTGGSVSRPTPDKLMRFKALHKIFDYNARFGGAEHMCVGCGRCVLRCPEEIDFLQTINRLHDETERLIAAQEAER